MIFTGLLLLLVEWYFQSKYLGSNFDIIFNGYSTFATLLLSSSIFLIGQDIENRISRNVLLKNGVNKIGSNTIGVYYIHWIIGNTLILKYFAFIHNSAFVNVVKALLLVIVCTLISELIKKVPILQKLLQ